MKKYKKIYLGLKEIINIKKEDLFPKPIKVSLWEKIKIILLGK
jgi:hypothetical protein